MPSIILSMTMPWLPSFVHLCLTLTRTTWLGSLSRLTKDNSMTSFLQLILNQDFIQKSWRKDLRQSWLFSLRLWQIGVITVSGTRSMTSSGRFTTIVSIMIMLAVFHDLSNARPISMPLPCVPMPMKRLALRDFLVLLVWLIRSFLAVTT